MKKKIILTIIFLISVLFLCSFSPTGLAFGQESPQENSIDEMTDKVIELSLAFHSLLEQLQEIINAAQPLHSLTLGDYLKKLFEENEIVLQKEEFFEEVDNPYLAFSKILNIVPSSYQASRRITTGEAEQISNKFLELKDKILLDGLYGKIDMHEHYRAGGDMEKFLKAAGSLGITKSIFVPTGMGPDNRGYKTHQKFLVKYIAELYPDKIIPFCTVDEQDPEAADILQECLEYGGKGLKLLGGHPNFYDEPLNSENMYKVYQVVDEYNVPVLLHASIMSFPEFIDQLEQIYSDFPDVIFIHAHYCSVIYKGINLDKCSRLLDKHPNLYIDLSMGGGIKRYHSYLRQDITKIKDFVLKYQDRILFGSDIILNQASYKTSDWLYDRVRCDIDLHQSKEYTCPFGEKDIEHQGFTLSKEVLRKLYFENPKKVLGF